MESCSLRSIDNTIEEALKIPNLSILERGRLLWRRGWAHTVLAPSQEARILALSFFNKALVCAVRIYWKEKQVKHKSFNGIDMIHFLNDPVLAEFIYEGSYRIPCISLTADLYSGAGHCQRDLGNTELGRKYSDLADRIKPWRRKRIHHYSNVVEPKVKTIPEKP